MYGDWGRTPAGEAEVAEVCTLAGELVGELDPSVETHALFLGAGTGRHVVELGARFGTSSAIDLSIDRMWLFDQLLQRPLELAAFEDSAPRGGRELTHLFRTVPPAPAPGRRLAVADARHLPLSDESQSQVFSIYFTDILPLGELLPEVARVLSPGGSFLHVGPLHYAFEDAAWRLAPDELAVVFDQFGLQIERIREQPLSLRRSSDSGLQLIYRALVFRARKTSG